MWDQRRRGRRDLRHYETWIAKLRQAPPAVFLGPDLPYGGVRGHVRAIHQYSALPVQLVPDESAMGGLENFTEEIRELFMDFEPVGRPVVHTHVLPWMIAWGRKQQQRGLNWIHTYHLPYFPENGQASLEPWQQDINDALIHQACHADVRLSVARWQQAYLRAEHGIETDYLPNGVDVAACDHGRAERFRQRHHLAGPFILFVGRNTPVKNPADFVRLAQLLPGHACVMLGHGLSPGSIRRDWALEPPPNLRIQGEASHAEVQDALAACAALVVTSKREGLPTLVLEAMAHQRPVMVPADAGCLEAISDGDYGEIYQPGDLDELARKTVAGMGEVTKPQRARQRVLAEFDWRVVAGKLDHIYRRGISS